MKRWNICVMDVAWNKPPYKPIPLSKKAMVKFFDANKKQ